MRKWFIGILWSLLVLGIAGTATVFWAIADGRIGYMPPIEELQNPINRFASQVYSADGELLGTFSLSHQNRVMVDYSQLPASLVEALVATEDARFFEHAGIDFKALGRAVVKRGILQRKSAGGGSTITQQLAKQLFSDVAHSTTERLLQKPIEWVIAIQLERNYTKEEIIAMYLNYYDFLNNAIGIKKAADTYFQCKEPAQLSITQSATLVGMCKNPSYFNPRRYPARCEERRNTVLQQMWKAGYLTEEEMDSCMEVSLADDLKFHVVDHNDGIATYFRDFLRRYMMAREPMPADYQGNQQKYVLDRYAWDHDPLYGWCNKNTKSDGSHYNVHTDGLKIYTTIDTRMQRYAEEACYEHVVKYLQPAFNQGNRGRRNAPYANSLSKAEVDRILKRSIRQSDRYRVLKEEGATDAEIERSFNTPVRMQVFRYDYRGEVDTTMTPRDSILYYKSFLRTGFFSMDPANGHVKAYVGGLDFQHFAYDMATEGRRQVGSTIKPFLYSLAVSPLGGMTPCTEVPCEQRTYYTESGQAWTPRNGSRAREGEMVTLKWGLQTSNNWVSAYLIDVLRPRNFLDHLKLFGFNNPNIVAGPALCLGPCENTVAEMVSAYTTFVNGGYRSAPVYVTKIVDSEGKVYTADQLAATGDDVLDKETADRMIYLLRGVVDGGTGSRLRRDPFSLTAPMGGKTGTTNSNSDGWFMGITPKLVSGCWVGGEDRDIHFESMAYAQGASAALPVFGKYMKKVYGNPALGISQNDQFRVDAGFDPCRGEDDDEEGDDYYEGDEEDDFEEVPLNEL